MQVKLPSFFFPEHPEIKQKKRVLLTSQCKLETLDSRLNDSLMKYLPPKKSSINHFEVRGVRWQDRPEKQSAQSESDISSSSTMCHSHGDATVTLSHGLFVAGGLFLWRDLLWHTHTHTHMWALKRPAGLFGRGCQHLYSSIFLTEGALYPPPKKIPGFASLPGLGAARRNG